MPLPSIEHHVSIFPVHVFLLNLFYFLVIEQEPFGVAGLGIGYVMTSFVLLNVVDVSIQLELLIGLTAQLFIMGGRFILTFLASILNKFRHRALISNKILDV